MIHGNDYSRYDLPISLELMLAQSDAFHEIGEEFVRTVAGRLRLVEIKGGKTIVNEGDPADELLFLLQGRVTVRTESITPNLEIGLSRLGAGEALGELAVFEGGHRSASLIALDTCVVAAIVVRELQDLCEATPSEGLRIYRNLGRIVADRLREMNRKVMNLVRQRYY